MKKALLIIALFFAFVSSNLTLASTQSYTSPWRKPYDEGESGIDRMNVNINSYCSFLQFSGTFSPSSSWPASDTYCDFSFYNIDPVNSIYGHVYGYIYGAYSNSNPSFSYVDSNYNYWGVIQATMNVSNGSATFTVDWY